MAVTHSPSKTTATPANALGEFPVELADRCVKCALCLPRCPTYQLTQDEAESPRGRIALMLAVAQGELEADTLLAGHLDRCLVCRTCESVCPADVPYGQLIDSARAGLAQHQLGDSRRLGWLRWLVATPRRIQLLAWLVWMVDRLGLATVARALFKPLTLGRLARMVRRPPRPRPVATRGPFQASHGRVYLFTGCMGPVLDNATNEAAVRVLEAMDFEVVIPREQACCGAIAFHGGHTAQARELARQNLAAFPGDDPILITASGCGAMLLDYPLVDDEAAALARRVFEISDFIAHQLTDGSIDVASLEKKVLLHTPCTLRNGMGGDGGARRLLEAIPGLRIVEADSGCCGAAGTYLLTQPALSDQLGQQAAMQATGVDLVATTNVGCAAQFAANLKENGAHAAVRHPVAILADQLRTPQTRDTV